MMFEHNRLAFMTFSVLKAPYGDPSVQEFDDRTPDTFSEAESTEGYITRAKPVHDIPWMTNYQKDWGDWGPFAVPRFYLGGTSSGDSYQAQTLSIWRDIYSVWMFAYRGHHHRIALKKSKEWFNKQNWPIYVAWWIDKNHQPTWPEACNRLEHLHDFGASPIAFTFKSAYGPDEKPCSPNAKLKFRQGSTGV